MARRPAATRQTLGNSTNRTTEAALNSTLQSAIGSKRTVKFIDFVGDRPGVRPIAGVKTPSTHAITTPSKTNRLIRLARISSGGVKSRSSFFASGWDGCFGTRDVYYGVAGYATWTNLGSAGCQPAVVGSLPTTYFLKTRVGRSCVDAFRQAAEKNRLGSLCSPAKDTR